MTIKNYALIKNGIVENIIIADESFIELIKDDYDAIIDHDAHPQNALIGGVAGQLEDGSWVFGANPIEPSVEPTFVESVRIEQPTIDAPIEGESI